MTRDLQQAENGRVPPSESKNNEERTCSDLTSEKKREEDEKG